MNRVYISLGSNRGKREENLQRSIELLNEKAGKVVQRSSVYETEPWQMTDSTNFLNQVVLLETALNADTLMDTILGIESALGRIRIAERYEPRTIDIDILFFNNDVLETEKVTVPHPHLHQRRFVLNPLSELAPGFIHPVLQKSMEQLLQECGDSLEVSRLVSK